MNEPFGPIGIISHTANEEFAREVSNILFEKRKKRVLTEANPFINSPGYHRSDYMMGSDLIRFQTLEGKFELNESVRGHDIYVITDVLSHNLTLSMQGHDHVISPDDHYRDLIRIISTCVGKARRVSVVMPFAYEGRREKRETNHESMDCADMLRQLYDLGVSNLIIFDPHDERIANAVPLMGIDFPRSAYKIISTLLNAFDSVRIDKDRTMVVSPDESGVNRAIFYSSMLNLPLGIFYRDRDYTVKVDGVHPVKDYRFLGDDVEGKDILIIDDMINSGDTMLRTSAKLKDKGARDIFCLAPYGLFTDGLEVFDRAYEDGTIKAVLCTNLIYRTPELLSRPWYRDVNMTPYVARIIDGLNVDESMYDLIHSTSRIQDLLGQVRIGDLLDGFDD
ncbi:MAG: ribose-phosphate diphosphokinase [Clostridiales bacterium]|nr:ribose-phosphate diphosphokinase [Clostridiales bacterium]